MIIWLASYPKSGNTYVRAFLSAYYFSKDGQFEFDQMSNIRQFPDKDFLNQNTGSVLDASKQWMPSQRKIIADKKIKFFKNHFSYDDEKALQMILDKKNILMSKGYETFSYIGSWASNYLSWLNYKNFRRLFVRYEDLLENKYETFRD